MKKIVKNKKGLTLIETVLALAIFIMSIAIFFSVIILVVKSHNNVSSINDLADYAMLNGKAFENTVQNAKALGTGSRVISVNADNQLCLDGAPLFDLEQYKTIPDGAQNKWTLSFTYDVKANGVVDYVFTVKDTAATSLEGMYVENGYDYAGSVYCPHLKAANITVGGGSDTFSFDNL